jgi:hypothetical protein
VGESRVVVIEPGEGAGAPARRASGDFSDVAAADRAGAGGGAARAPRDRHRQPGRARGTSAESRGLASRSSPGAGVVAGCPSDGSVASSPASRTAVQECPRSTRQPSKIVPRRDDADRASRWMRASSLTARSTWFAFPKHRDTIAMPEPWSRAFVRLMVCAAQARGRGSASSSVHV